MHYRILILAAILLAGSQCATAGIIVGGNDVDSQFTTSRFLDAMVPESPQDCPSRWLSENQPTAAGYAINSVVNSQISGVVEQDALPPEDAIIVRLKFAHWAFVLAPFMDDQLRPS